MSLSKQLIALVLTINVYNTQKVSNFWISASEVCQLIGSL